MRYIILTLLLSLMSAVVSAQISVTAENYRVYDGQGNAASVDAIVKALDSVDVVFLGEQHDDAVAHALQVEIFKQAVTQYLATRKVALSLEMFERDVQIVVDEYLKGQISEAQFLAFCLPLSN